MAALVMLTLREAVRSRVLLGMTGLMCLFAIGSLLWPSDNDGQRVILVQRHCYRALTFFGLLAAAFLGGASLPREISSKRIYSLATKPVSRFEMLLGRAIGLITVMFVFLVLGGAITLVVTHIASARKTYAGGSYTAEVSDATAKIVAEDGSSEEVKRGQILPVSAKSSDGYRVSLAGREEEFAGSIAARSVQLHERSLALRRMVKPAQVTAVCQGKVEVSNNEVLLWCGELARNHTWTFDLRDLKVPQLGGDVPIRLRFWRLQHEPTYTDRTKHQAPIVLFRLRNPATGETAHAEGHFTYLRAETRPVPERGKSLDRYDAVVAVPLAFFQGDTLEAVIKDYEPKYPPGGRVFYTPSRTPTWSITGIDPGQLPEGQQTIRAQFIILNRRGIDLIDHTNITARIGNPATGDSETYQLNLRSQTPTHIRFPRRLIDDDKGVTVTLSGMRSTVAIGHASNETPIYLVRTPGSLWGSTGRSLALLFLQLSLFTVLAVAASTFLSAKVAILFTLVVALAGWVKDLILETRTAAELARPLASEAATLQEAAGLWISYLLKQLLVGLAPGFRQFSSSTYVSRSWAVPWSAVGNALSYAMVYTLICFGLGYLFFRAREFE